jgi:hypothetical protein
VIVKESGFPLTLLSPEALWKGNVKEPTSINGCMYSELNPLSSVDSAGDGINSDGSEDRSK